VRLPNRLPLRRVLQSVKARRLPIGHRPPEDSCAFAANRRSYGYAPTCLLTKAPFNPAPLIRKSRACKQLSTMQIWPTLNDGSRRSNYRFLEFCDHWQALSCRVAVAADDKVPRRSARSSAQASRGEVRADTKLICEIGRPFLKPRRPLMRKCGAKLHASRGLICPGSGNVCATLALVSRKTGRARLR
jgi:hypothetical protein